MGMLRRKGVGEGWRLELSEGRKGGGSDGGRGWRERIRTEEGRGGDGLPDCRVDYWMMEDDFAGGKGM